MSMHRYKMAHHYQGLSLIELMVALVMSALITLFIANLHLNHHQTYQSTEDLGRLQENLRFASHTLTRDFRGAGYIGCPRNHPDNISTQINNPDFQKDFTKAISSYEAKQTNPGDSVDLSFDQSSANDWQPVLPALNTRTEQGDNLDIFPHSDIFIVRRAASETLTQVTDMTSGTITANGILSAVTSTQQDPESVALFISNCTQSVIFQPTSIKTNSVSYTTLGEDFTQSFSELMVGSSAIYFVAQNKEDSEPGLYRQLGDNAPVAIAQGIENIQILYGIDTDTDGIANQYVTGDAMQVEDIASIRISMLARTKGQHHSSEMIRSYNLAGTTINVQGDRRIRQVVDLTIQVRNAQIGAIDASSS